MKKVIKFASKGVQLGKGRPSKSSKKLLQRMGKEKASAEKWNDPDYTPGPTMSNHAGQILAYKSNVPGVKRKTRGIGKKRKEYIESPEYKERLTAFETEWSDLIKDAARKSFPFGLSEKTLQTMRDSYWISRQMRGL